jgi:hypothetical protein
MSTRTPSGRQKRAVGEWYDPRRAQPWLSALALCLSVGCVKGRCYQGLDCPASQVCGASGMCVSRDVSGAPDATSATDAPTAPEAFSGLDSTAEVDASESETSESGFDAEVDADPVCCADGNAP